MQFQTLKLNFIQLFTLKKINQNYPSYEESLQIFLIINKMPKLSEEQELVKKKGLTISNFKSYKGFVKWSNSRFR